MYTGLITPPTIGRNLFGRERFAGYMRKGFEGGNAIVVAGAKYDFFGTAYFKKAKTTNSIGCNLFKASGPSGSTAITSSA